MTSAYWDVKLRANHSANRLSHGGHFTSHSNIVTFFRTALNSNCFRSAQLGTTAFPINAHLHKIGIRPSPMCDKCNVLDDITHFLTACTKYSEQRATFFNEIGRTIPNFLIIAQFFKDNKPENRAILNALEKFCITTIGKDIFNFL